MENLISKQEKESVHKNRFLIDKLYIIPEDPHNRVFQFVKYSETGSPAFKLLSGDDRGMMQNSDGNYYFLFAATMIEKPDQP